MATIRELKAVASSLHIKGYSNMTKAQLESAITATTTTLSEDSMNTTEFTFKARELPFMVLSGYKWAAIALYNNRNHIKQHVIEDSIITATIAYDCFIMSVLFITQCWEQYQAFLARFEEPGFLVEDGEDITPVNFVKTQVTRGAVGFSYLLDDAKEGMLFYSDKLVDYLAKHIEWGLGSGYWFCYVGEHWAKVTWKPRLAVVIR